MKLPNELYAIIENSGTADEFINAIADANDFAVVGETVTATLYRKVGTVKIKTTAEIAMPKDA